MPAPPTFRMDVVTEVHDDLYEALDRLQRLSMGTLSSAAAQSQVYGGHMLTELCRNQQVVKVLVFDEPDLVGFGAVTDDLDALLEFNGAFFRRLYPNEAQRRTLWYAVAGIVDPQYWRTGILSAMGEELADLLLSRGAEVLLWDAVDVRFDLMYGWVDKTMSSRFGSGLEHTQIDSIRWMATRLSPVDRVVVDLTGDQDPDV